MRVTPPRLAQAALLAAIVLLATAACVVTFGGYARHAHADGQVVSSSGVATVAPVINGTIATIEAHDGERVHRGQILFTLSDEATTANGDDTKAERVTQLSEKQRTLKADLSSLEGNKAESLQQLRDKVDSKQVQLASLNDQLKIQIKRTEASKELYDQWVRLGSTGFVSKAQVIQQRDAVLAGQALESQIRGSQATLAEDLSAARSELNRFDSDFATRSHELQRSLSDVDSEIAKARLELGSSVRSPIDGIVSTVLVHPGQHVTTQDTLLTVMPNGMSSMAEIWIPSASVGFVAPGQRVNLKYKAYPFRTYGIQTGVVVEVSDVALSTDSIGKALGHPVSEPGYRALVRLDRQYIASREGTRPLRVGMLLEGDVILGKRRLIDWLIDPVETSRPGTRPLSSAGDKT